MSDLKRIEQLITLFTKNSATHFVIGDTDQRLIREALEAKKVKMEQFDPSYKPHGDFSE